jgi:hypothetical protein
LLLAVLLPELLTPKTDWPTKRVLTFTTLAFVVVLVLELTVEFEPELTTDVQLLCVQTTGAQSPQRPRPVPFVAVPPPNVTDVALVFTFAAWLVVPRLNDVR